MTHQRDGYKDGHEDETVAKARRILERAKNAPSQEQFKRLRERGIIDDRGNVQIPPRPLGSNGVDGPQGSDR